MLSQINITPTDDEKEGVFERYESQEKFLPKAPRQKGRSFGWALLLLEIIILGIPCILIALLRIPLLIIRRFRLSYLKLKSKKYFEKYIKPDPDNAGREFYFEAPEYKRSTNDIKYETFIKEQRKKMEQSKTEWLNNQSNIDKLLEYCYYESMVNGHPGRYLVLFILDQLINSDHKNGKVYMSLAAITGPKYLNLSNNSYHYEKLAIENNFVTPKKKRLSFSNYLAISILANSVFYLVRDLKNIWPKYGLQNK